MVICDHPPHQIIPPGRGQPSPLAKPQVASPIKVGGGGARGRLCLFPFVSALAVRDSSQKHRCSVGGETCCSSSYQPSKKKNRHRKNRARRIWSRHQTPAACYRRHFTKKLSARRTTHARVQAAVTPAFLEATFKAGLNDMKRERGCENSSPPSARDDPTFGRSLAPDDSRLFLRNV